jgi:hypothetical protein
VLYYAASPEKWWALKEEREAFEDQYEVAKGLQERATGIPGTEDPARWFPSGCFPPALPFVGAKIPSSPAPPTRCIEVLIVGKETQVVRGPIPVIDVPRQVRDPDREAAQGAEATRMREGPARGSPGA